MADTQHVFTYGSLMFPVVWQRVVQASYRSNEATILGFKRVRVRGEHYPALIIDANALALRGRVYFDVSPDDIARLDHFETNDYMRVSVAVRVDGNSLAAQAYLALKPDRLEHLDWSAEEFEQHGLEPFLATYATTNAPPA